MKLKFTMCSKGDSWQKSLSSAGATPINQLLDVAAANLGVTVTEEIREKFEVNCITSARAADGLTQEQWEKLALPMALENELKELLEEGKQT
jgi:hypothetical protein